MMNNNILWLVTVQLWHCNFIAVKLSYSPNNPEVNSVTRMIILHDARLSLSISLNYTVSQKTRHQSLAPNFTKYLPIFTLFHCWTQ